MHKIDLIRRADVDVFLARVFDYSESETGLMVFVSANSESASAAIGQAQDWAIATLGHELEVIKFIEVLEPRWPGGEMEQSPGGRQAKNWIKSSRVGRRVDQGNC